MKLTINSKDGGEHLHQSHNGDPTLDSYYEILWGYQWMAPMVLRMTVSKNLDDSNYQRVHLQLDWHQSPEHKMKRKAVRNLLRLTSYEYSE